MSKRKGKEPLGYVNVFHFIQFHFQSSYLRVIKQDA